MTWESGAEDMEMHSLCSLSKKKKISPSNDATKLDASEHSIHASIIWPKFGNNTWLSNKNNDMPNRVAVCMKNTWEQNKNCILIQGSHFRGISKFFYIQQFFRDK